MTTQEKTKRIKKCRGKSLAELRPDLAKEWDYEKNGDLTPEMVTCGVGTDVHWLLHYDDARTGKHFVFTWEAKVKCRTRGNGCPYLSGQAVWVGFNDLETVIPELAAQWHPFLNGNLTPRDVTSSARKKVWWLLPYDDPFTGKHFDFVWEATINHRAKGTGCPYLAGKKIYIGFNDLPTTRPGLAAQWHPTLNGSLTPEMVTSNSREYVWWFFPYDDPVTGKHFDFVWEARISSRNSGRDCPYLVGKAVWEGYNDLASKAPELIPQWHPHLNGELTPQRVTSHSNKPVWWRCNECGYEWQAAPCDRVRGNGCPHCSESRGEARISRFCEANGIEFCEQYKIDGCVYKRKLPFDIAIFRKDGTLVFLIEFDGRQHFEPVDFSGKTDGMEEFLLTQTRDKIKNEFCKKNRIPLVRISYKDYDNIEKILSKKMAKYELM